MDFTRVQFAVALLVLTALQIAIGGATRTWVHPRPSLYWSQPTTMRDAHLMMAAFEARGSDLPAIVVGDLNAVPWERTVRRAMRIGELLDPRVGRGLYPTYDVQSWIMSWPLDQILFQNSFGLAEWDVLRSFGSDHSPVFAALCLAPDLAARQSASPLEAGDVKEAERSIIAARRMNEQPLRKTAAQKSQSRRRYVITFRADQPCAKTDPADALAIVIGSSSAALLRISAMRFCAFSAFCALAYSVMTQKLLSPVRTI